MLTRTEFNQITREILPKIFIQIPPECIIVRLKDVIEILEYFTDKEEPNGKSTEGQFPNSSDGSPVMG